MMKVRTIIFYFLLFAAPGIVWAQGENLGTKVFSNKRIALVIGNASYQSNPLRNPVNDARAIREALKTSGFEVLYYENLGDKDAMKRAVREFGQALQGSEVGLFYYAGHGVQVKGQNYLMPVKAQINYEEEVEYEALDVGFILAQMEAAQNQMNIVILDACRNNPYSRSMRSATNGLATMNAPTGTMIAYATAPGSVAIDGNGDNGLYTEELLNQIRRPGLKIEEVFKNVRAEVLKKSNSLQVPWESSSLIGDFYFIFPENLVFQSNPSTYNNPVTKPVTNHSETEDFSLPVKDYKPTIQWKALKDNYWLTVDGKSIEKETVSQWKGADLIVMHSPTGKNYLLSNFIQNADNQWRDAIELSGGIPNNPAVGSNSSSNTQVNQASKYVSNNRSGVQSTDASTLIESTFFSGKNTVVSWKANKQGYWIYLDGRDITSLTTSEWKMENLLVHYKEGQLSLNFILRNYASLLDAKLRPGEIVLPDEMKGTLTNVQWRANKKGYWLYINGKDESVNTTNVWDGNDLIVTHRDSGKRFLLKNYVNSQNDNYYKADLLE
jgi:hypothetical protein